MTTRERVLEYIEKGWDDTTRFHPKDEEAGVATLYGVPYPYTIPAAGMFEELYYQDAYYNNIGLELSGRYQLAKNDIDDILFMIERFGWMKNSNRHFHAGVSHPPYSSAMVRSIYDHYKDKSWLYGAYNTLKKEYNFWMTERMTEIGLNQYGGKNTDKSEAEKAADFCHRISGRPEGMTDKELVDEYMIFCECGQDANPRWGFEGRSTVQIDLNCLLYLYETNMAYFSEQLGMNEEKIWLDASEKRKALMKRYMLCDEGYYTDYNFVKGTHSKVFSASNFFAMYVGLADENEAKCLVDNLCRLELKYGLAACEKNEYCDKYTLQWNYPIIWSFFQYITPKGLDRYGYKEKAKEILGKYVELIDKNFAQTGKIWEKYNGIDGSLDVIKEYEMPPMVGANASVYLAALHYFETGII